jgi:hypothetical protein
MSPYTEVDSMRPLSEDYPPNEHIRRPLPPTLIPAPPPQTAKEAEARAENGGRISDLDAHLATLRELGQVKRELEDQHAVNESAKEMASVIAKAREVASALAVAHHDIPELVTAMKHLEAILARAEP